MKEQLRVFIEDMTEAQMVYAYIFLSKMFSKESEAKGASA